eukprot:CAMPEP_0175327050 /NCGR_PEP_ID=MMETSP0093-20121207/74843_1 /TAXON_ID=311494 /ORGANISM="Alexandrium monilatum, Strain CCMP3105" /LENGTH=154 /DNA_ID=CAMNT_0016624063 /DNA_START=149 /DNA_END=610 /DNA_ORIENTATION=-
MTRNARRDEDRLVESGEQHQRRRACVPVHLAPVERRGHHHHVGHVVLQELAAGPTRAHRAPARSHGHGRLERIDGAQVELCHANSRQVDCPPVIGPVEHKPLGEDRQDASKIAQEIQACVGGWSSTRTPFSAFAGIASGAERVGDKSLTANCPL